MPGPEERPPFEILEHTADVGLRVHGHTREELFENAARGTLEILGAAGLEGAEQTTVAVEAIDPPALLVHFLDELIYLVDARNARIADVRCRFESPAHLIATFWWSPSDEPLPGTELKAATFHQLDLTEQSDGWHATVYFDV